MMKDFLLSSRIKFLQTVIAIFILVQINSRDISDCTGETSENDFQPNSCFNNLIRLDNCKRGQFTEDKDGNLFLLYVSDPIISGDMNRLIYGLKKNGKSYFSNDPQEEIIISPESYDHNNNVESRIIFFEVINDSKEILYMVKSLMYPFVSF